LVRSGIEAARALELLGPSIDVYLNDTTCWRCVPKAVWDYVIGGYQVLKKWLSYRELDILGRPLTKEEAREFTSDVRRIAAIVLMTDRLNTNYISARDSAFVWPSEPAKAEVPRWLNSGSRMTPILDAPQRFANQAKVVAQRRFKRPPLNLNL
jgi:hypothetical protein